MNLKAPTQKRQGWPQNLLSNAGRKSENLAGHKEIKGNFKEKVLLLILPKSWGARAPLTPSVPPALLPQKQLEWPQSHLLLSPRGRSENLRGQKEIEGLVLLARSLRASAPLAPPISPALLPLPLLSSHQQVRLISLISKRWSKLCRLCIKENILKVKGNWLLWNIKGIFEGTFKIGETMASL